MNKSVRQESDSIGPWVLGIIMGVLALVGLAMASNAHDAVFYGTGLGVFVFGVGFIFALIHRHSGHAQETTGAGMRPVARPEAKRAA